MTPQSYLSLLTYLGLAIGFAGGVVSQLKKTSTEVDGTNEKKLTSFGKLALAVSITGFAGSFSSELLKSFISHDQVKIVKAEKEDEAKWKIRSDQITSEILRNTTSALATTLDTRLAISEARQKLLTDNLARETQLYGRLSAVGAPLTSIRMTLIVEHPPNNVMNHLRRGESNARVEYENSLPHDWILPYPEEEESDVKRIVGDELIQPFINLIAGNGFLSKNGIIALTLDGHYSTLLSIGRIQDTSFYEGGGGKSLLPSGISAVSSPDPQALGTRLIGPEVHIAVVKDSILLSIDVEANAMDGSFLRFSSATMNASLPDDVELFVWTPQNGGKTEDESRMPFDTHGVDSGIPGYSMYPNRETHGLPGTRMSWIQSEPRWARNMRLLVVPNHIQQISKTYDLSLFSTGEVYGYGNLRAAGDVRFWHGHSHQPAEMQGSSEF